MRLGQTLTGTKVTILMSSHAVLRFVYIDMQTSVWSHKITLKAIYRNRAELSRSEFVQAARDNP